MEYLAIPLRYQTAARVCEECNVCRVTAPQCCAGGPTVIGTVRCPFRLGPIGNRSALGQLSSDNAQLCFSTVENVRSIMRFTHAVAHPVEMALKKIGFRWVQRRGRIAMNPETNRLVSVDRQWSVTSALVRLNRFRLFCLRSLTQWCVGRCTRLTQRREPWLRSKSRLRYMQYPESTPCSTRTVPHAVPGQYPMPVPGQYPMQYPDSTPCSTPCSTRAVPHASTRTEPHAAPGQYPMHAETRV